MLNYKPVVLLVLDGFGVAPPSDSNAVYQARTPFFDSIPNNYPTVLLDAAGLSVGLPYGEVGNSEVGHYNIGSGQLIYQSLPRINISIEDGSFFNLPYLLGAIERVKQSGKKLHLIGLIGTGGVHAHQRHLLALLAMCKKYGVPKNQVKVHAFLDGRDTPRDVAKGFMKQIVDEYGDVADVATLSGRFYAMDRNNKWDRTQMAYEAIVHGVSEQTCTDPVKAITDSYGKEVFDEEFVPTVVVGEDGKPLGTVEDGDTVIFFNFRADRIRQMTEAFVLPDSEFDNFDRKGRVNNLVVITFTEYKEGLPVHVLFPPQIIEEPLAKIISDAGLTQLHIAETEKYAHVTFFLNGLIEKAFPGEDRVLIPSPPVTSYDEKPEMSASEITDRIVEEIEKGSYDVIMSNYANGDMVGHTGNREASIKAVETLDVCVKRVVDAILAKDGICFITADHGNVEEVENVQTYAIDKEHSVYPVPFYIIANDLKGNLIINPPDPRDLSGFDPQGILADVAPTILNLIGLKPIEQMKGGITIERTSANKK